MRVGWKQWDPIGLDGLEGTPDDEYGGYLLQAAAKLWNGKSEDEVADYLVGIEAEYMGLSHRKGIHQRARQVAKALNAYVQELRADPENPPHP